MQKKRSAVSFLIEEKSLSVTNNEDIFLTVNASKCIFLNTLAHSWCFNKTKVFLFFSFDAFNEFKKY